MDETSQCSRGYARDETADFDYLRVNRGAARKEREKTCPIWVVGQAPELSIGLRVVSAGELPRPSRPAWRRLVPHVPLPRRERVDRRRDGPRRPASGAGPR